MLTDKLTGFIKLSLMRKSQQLNSLELFDDSDFFDDLEVLNEGASWRPVNLIVFGVAILRAQSNESYNKLESSTKRVIPSTR